MADFLTAFKDFSIILGTLASIGSLIMFYKQGVFSFKRKKNPMYELYKGLDESDAAYDVYRKCIHMENLYDVIGMRLNEQRARVFLDYITERPTISFADLRPLALYYRSNGVEKNGEIIFVQPKGVWVLLSRLLVYLCLFVGSLSFVYGLFLSDSDRAEFLVLAFIYTFLSFYVYAWNWPVYVARRVMFS